MYINIMLLEHSEYTSGVELIAFQTLGVPKSVVTKTLCVFI